MCTSYVYTCARGECMHISTLTWMYSDLFLVPVILCIGQTKRHQIHQRHDAVSVYSPHSHCATLHQPLPLLTRRATWRHYVKLSAASECSPVGYGIGRRGANNTFTAGEIPSRGGLLCCSVCWVKFVRILQGLMKDQAKLAIVSKTGAGVQAWGTGCAVDLGHYAPLQSVLKNRCLVLLQGTETLNTLKKNLERTAFVCPCFDQWFSTAAPRGLSSVP